MAAAHRGHLLTPATYRERGLLPLPATYRVGDKRIRRASEMHRYARRLMADLPHWHLHPQIPGLLREMAHALEQGDRLQAGRSNSRSPGTV
jgi:hypothetical protein